MASTTKAAERRFTPATIALVLAGILFVTSFGYWILFRPSETTSGNSSAAATSNAQAAPTLATAIASLQNRLREDPDNHELWYRLGQAQREDGQFRASVQSFRRAMELSPQNPDYAAYLGEMILAEAMRTSAPIPPESERLFRRALELQPGNAQARFYLATIRDMRGDHRGAIDDLIALLRDAPVDAPWEPQVRQTVQNIARANNIDIANRLPPSRQPEQSVATRGIPGPNQQQLEQARNLPPGEQQRMAQGMVERLAARLRQNPRDANGWMMLMRSYMVQQQPDQAREALRSALAAFANDAATQTRLRTAAQELNVPNPG
ncbi:tetratricopeptide repeat protein [Sphingosinicella sp.]|uniref:tetratricopeptide repeat protein n=1 Tax=Sphingosinicella sp. TaxID=1917971 RepID=UPI0040382B38